MVMHGFILFGWRLLFWIFQYGTTVLATSEQGWVFSTQDIWNGGRGLGPISEFHILNPDGGLLKQT